MQGFIGLGNMGAAIAEQLLKSGVDLCVFDLNAQAVAHLVKAGATPCASVREVADRAELVLTCLPTPAVSVAVAREAATGSSINLLADLSTIGPQAIREMKALLDTNDIALVDAPVSGGPLGARQGTLSLMLSGQQNDLDRVAQVCQAVTGKVTRIGPEPGQAQLSKLMNNGISMTAFLVSCEVVACAVAAGLPTDTVIDHVNAGRGRNSGTVTKLPKNILQRTFDLGPTLISAVKDQDLYLAEYHKTGLPPGVIAGTRELWAHTATVLDPQGDAATIVRYFEQFTGAEVRSGGSGNQAQPVDASLLTLVDNVIAFTVLAATCESVAVGLAAAIDPRIQLDFLNAGTAGNYWTASVFESQVLSRRFGSGTTIRQACADLRRYLELAKGLGLPDGLVRTALTVWEQASLDLGEDQDVTAMLTRYEKHIGREFA